MKASLLRFSRVVATLLTFVVGVFGLMQVVPYGRGHSNPPVIHEPAWDSPRTRELAVRACFDCHSNETRWPGYARVAPFSWVMQRDVEVGRSVLNFSEWTRPYALSHEAGHAVLRRNMPPRSYKMLHEHAQLTHEETVELSRGLDATLGVRRAVAATP